MKQANILMVLLLAAVGLFSSCEKEEGPTASATFTTITSGDIDGDVTGNGGSFTKTYTWQNSMPTADYNMDITASRGGSFQLVIKDAEGKNVLDKKLTAGDGEDSKSGVTSSSGLPGAWTVTIVLTDFNGDGSFSLSKGD
ncbi:hypothetical protein [Pontibacter pamirensis]|uniref:hypothetical protein n=1 Tax=Pontibacter pamirensis TaxID=2562824 RepID=UPI00138A3DD0|nr:hypothetical protein [Pontibacter pamirensis]